MKTLNQWQIQPFILLSCPKTFLFSLTEILFVPDKKKKKKEKRNTRVNLKKITPPTKGILKNTTAI